MTTIKEATEQIGGIFTSVVTIKKQLDDLTRLLERQSDEISALRAENAKLTTRIAVLEEARNTTAQTVRAEVAVAVADLKSRYTEVVGNLTVDFKLAKIDMERQMERQRAEPVQNAAAVSPPAQITPTSTG